LEFLFHPCLLWAGDRTKEIGWSSTTLQPISFGSDRTIDYFGYGNKTSNYANHPAICATQGGEKG